MSPHHSPHQVEEEFQFDPYTVKTWQAQDETVVEYFLGDEVIGRFNIRLSEDGGVEWTRAWVRDDHQGQGIYTHLHKWALTQPSSKILAVGEQTEMYRDSGYKEIEPGVLKQEKVRSRKWLKGR